MIKKADRIIIASLIVIVSSIILINKDLSILYILSIFISISLFTSCAIFRINGIHDNLKEEKNKKVICPNCNHSNKPGSYACSKCGFRLR